MPAISGGDEHKCYGRDTDEHEGELDPIDHWHPEKPWLVEVVEGRDQHGQRHQQQQVPPTELNGVALVPAGSLDPVERNPAVPIGRIPVRAVVLGHDLHPNPSCVRADDAAATGGVTGKNYPPARKTIS